MYSVEYHIENGYSATYYHNGEWLGMTEPFDTFEALQVHVSLQLKQWIN